MVDLKIGGSLPGIGSMLGTGDAGKAKAAGGFGEMLGEALQSTLDASKTAEMTSAKAVAGKADITDVVTAVSNAEMALDTVVSIRDKVISAYQEIIRMPI